MRLSQKVAALSPSATLEITERAARMRESGRDIISLSAGEPDFETPEPIREAACRAIGEGRTKYTPTAGIPALRRAVAEQLRREQGFAVDPGQVLISCGAKHAIFNVLLATLNEGDEVLIPAPYWVSYPEMVRAAGATPVFVPGDPARAYRVTAGALRDRITSRTAMLVMNSPHNPTGHVYGREEWNAIAQVALAYDVWILSDEIYEKLIYEGEHVSPAALSDEVRARTILVNGVSKAFAMTGWRIGWAVGPREVIDLAARVQSQSTSNPASISQYAAVAALEGGDGSTRRMADEFRRRRDRMLALLQRSVGLVPLRPAGAFYIFVDISATGLDSVAFCQRLLEQEGVALVPGAAFGSDRHVRLSFAAPMETLQRAAERIERFAQRLVR